MYFLFDIGGTKMRFAVSEDCIECTEPKVVKTPDSYEESLQEIETAARELGADKDITGAIGGIAGTLNRDKTSLVFSPNNPDWVGQTITDDFEERIGSPATIENDTAVIALGEATYGAGKGADIVAYMTVSTGVGGSRVVEGRMDAKARTFEPGHQIVHCPSEGPTEELRNWTLENLVSGTAMEKRFGMKAYNIENRDVWSQVAKELAVGLHNTLLHWSPDVMVMGGAMITGSPCISMEELCENVATLSPTLFDSCQIVEAELGDLNGLYGAMAWAKQLYR